VEEEWCPLPRLNAKDGREAASPAVSLRRRADRLEVQKLWIPIRPRNACAGHPQGF